MSKLVCQKCKTPLRMGVDVFVDLSAIWFRKINKSTFRDSTLKIYGVKWESSIFYCPKPGCGFAESFSVSSASAMPAQRAGRQRRQARAKSPSTRRKAR